ncbi:hypothetical protein SB816_31460, partial [Achromobacter sp. SIMBA_011]|uniref:hypothetical protein n=1 Tax=Achromobacter sp. SIMBA_011 TaxID=3085759 RepID=UPI00397DF856
DARERQIKFRGRNGSLGDFYLGLALTACCLRVIEGLARHGPIRSQCFGPPEIDFGLIEQNLCLLQLGFGSVQRNLEWSRIDLEEKLSRSH